MNVESVAAELGSDVELVTVEKVGEVIKVALKQYQHDRSIWTRINRNLKQLGGAWVSNGKMSHWAVPVTTVKPMIPDDEFEDVWKAAGNAKVALDRLADEIGKLQAKREKAK